MTPPMMTFNIGLRFELLLRVDHIYGIEPTKKRNVVIIHHRNGTHEVNEDYMDVVTTYYDAIHTEPDEEFEE